MIKIHFACIVEDLKLEIITVSEISQTHEGGFRLVSLPGGR